MTTIKQLISAFAFATLLTACKEANNQSATVTTPKSAPSVFRQALPEAPTSIDPLKTSSAYSGAIVGNVYDTLYRYALLADPIRLVPNLATGMPEVSADGLRYRIQIKQGVHFHDSPAFAGGVGRELTADDIVFSIRRHLQPELHSEMGWLFADIKGVSDWVKAGAKSDQAVAGLRAVSKDIIEFEFTQPPATFVATLAHPASAVVPPEALSYFKGNINTQAIGSGPFQLERFDSSVAVLVRNSKFRKEPIDLAQEGFDPAKHTTYGLAALGGKTLPLIDRIELHFIAEAQTATLALERAEIDSISMSIQAFSRFAQSNVQPPALRPEFDERFFMRSKPELGSIFISFNMADPRIGHGADVAQNTRNKALRCAIVESYDWAQRREKIYLGGGVSYRGAIPPGIPGFNSADLEPKANLTLARQLLKDAEWTDGLPTLQYGSSNSLEQRRIFELFRSQMLALGFGVEQIQWQSYPSYGAYLDAVNQRQVMLMEMGWQMDAPDAENMLQLYYGPYAAPNVNNANYQNPAFDAAFEQAKKLPVGAKRSEAFAALNRILIDDCVAITGFSRMGSQLWLRDVIAWPSSGLTAGASLRFVTRP